MNQKRKNILLCLLLGLALVFAGCAFEQTPYAINDSENFNVSIKFDANGGTFTDNAPVIVDSYDVSGMKADGDGKVQIPILAPDDPQRDKDAFKPTKNGCFLAGWYSQRTESTDAQGNVTYTYGGKWDFSQDRVEVETAAEHSSQEPILTLYAAWAPLYEIEFYTMDSGEQLGSYAFDPSAGTQVQIPAWNAESGALDMFKFPKREGYTFHKAYYDAEGTQAVDTQTLTHPGTLDEQTGCVENAKMKLYVDWLPGEWYRISTAEQFSDNFSLDGSYELLEDLDFSDEIWPTAMMYGSFTGQIKGNGHTIRNVSITQTDNSKLSAGLFGQLTESAVIENVTFENVTFTIKNGARMAGTGYGLLAGSVSEGAALEGVSVVNSLLQIDSGCYFGTDDYTIGLVCGMGQTNVDDSGITCQAVGDKPESVVITVNEATVTVEFITQ